VWTALPLRAAIRCCGWVDRADAQVGRDQQRQRSNGTDEGAARGTTGAGPSVAMTTTASAAGPSGTIIESGSQRTTAGSASGSVERTSAQTASTASSVWPPSPGPRQAPAASSGLGTGSGIRRCARGRKFGSQRGRRWAAGRDRPERGHRSAEAGGQCCPVAPIANSCGEPIRRDVARTNAGCECRSAGPLTRWAVRYGHA